MTDRNSPRRATRGFFLIVTLWTVILTIPPVLALFDNMKAAGTGLLQANALTDVVTTALSVLLCLGMLLAIILPGKRLGYLLSAFILRLYNVFCLAVLGVMGLAFVALVVIACMQIISLPMALVTLAVLVVAAACMTLATLYVHHLAESLKELSLSARAGKWQSPTGYKAPIRGMSVAMLCIGAVITVGMLLCASAAPHDGVVALFDSAAAAVYEAAPTASRALVRSLGESLRPLLNVKLTAVVGSLMACVRYLFIILAYQEYMRMNATFKHE